MTKNENRKSDGDNLIDFHTHILPGIDDGSRDLQMTKEMLGMERDQAVTKIIASPHFYASEMSMKHFLRRRDEAWGMVKDQLYTQDKTYPEIMLAAEVYYFRDMGQADLSDLCIQGTSLLLLEMPFAQWTKKVYQDMESLINRQHLKLIIAHVERYYHFQKDKSIWDQVFALPLIAQFNAGCLDSWTRRRQPLRFMKEGYPSILGSDCHNMDSRKPNLLDGRGILEKKLGRGYLDQMDDLGQKLLKDYQL